MLVTGAAGFIGSTLVERLLAEGRSVVGFDNFDPYYPEEQKRRNLARALDHAAYELVEGDIRDEAAVERLFAQGDFAGLVHLAALAGVRPSLERPAAYADVNVRGTTQLFEAAVRHGAPRVVFASSSSVYGEREDGPFREIDPVERPISPYAATKRAGELMAHSFHHAHGLSVTCARIFTAYGPRQRPDLAIRKFAERMRSQQPVPIYGDGSSLRDFTFVDDLVDGLLRALDRDLGFAILNFGAGRKISVLEVVKLLEQNLGQTADIEWLPAQTGDVKRTWADIDAARDALGYAPGVAFEEGVRLFVDWLADSEGTGS
ncbi:MAG: SDR family NAD(P)-dependent oxidoreductase [Deltaproteobacteria bacterium]|nr:SDR family NAD(P)-dependent oxidoreductase [Deltaproteobacteria bacterium]MBW2360326.1 SDR family NAD(P)-dependent oxidoreductase [Deltaproteobacteria bacterium]